MSIDVLKKLMSFLGFCLVQVLVLNHVHLFGVATPLLYIYFVLRFRRHYSKAGIMLWSFVMGVVLDTFTNTPGVAAASLTLLGALQPYVLLPFIPRDSADDLRPSIRSLGASSYTYYLLILSLLYHLVFFSLEMFSFFNWLYWAECVVGSWVFTVLLILMIEMFRRDS